jgi:GTP-binding protein
LSDNEARLLSWKPFAPYSAGSWHVDFIGAHTTTLPPRLGAPEVAFLGRSNVGKSSLLNALLRTDVARVGKTPGATASVNLYSIYSGGQKNEAAKKKPILGMVDLPGFGYAKLSKSVKDNIGKLAETYLDRREELAVGILLVDIRREPQADDQAVLAALYDVGVPVLIVATKLDKMKSDMERDTQLSLIRDKLGLPDGQPLAVSSVTGDGCRLLWRIIMEACADHVAILNERYVEPELDEELPVIAAGDESPDESMIVNDDDDDNDDDIAYEQGYDWIQGTVMLEPDDDDSYFMDDEETIGDVSSKNKPDTAGKVKTTKDVTAGSPRSLAKDDWDNMTIKDWDRKSRDLERQGLL